MLPVAVGPKVVSAAEAVARIADGATIAIQGAGGGTGEPTALLRALRARFDATQSPRGLALLHATGLGDKNEIGADLLAVPGLVARDIAGHLGMAPKMAALIQRDEIECYNWPQGVISHLFRATAARTPGVLTKVGLHTYIDPRLEGGRMNARTARDLVQVVQLAGEEWLFFPRQKIDVAFVRGTTADLKGNVAAEDEAAIYEGISIAQAAKASGGIVVAQVKRLTETGALNPREVVIPGVSVDFVVVDPAQKQTCAAEFDPSLSGAVRAPLAALPQLALDERKVVARRAAQELFPGAALNVGVGMPDGIAPVAAEMGRLAEFTFTIEQGLVGGMPAGGVIFGVSHNPEARIHQSHQFDFYDGGGLDLAFLGMAQTDANGSVNVSKVGPLLSGCGGFINISQNAKRLVFCGTFTAKGLDLEVGGGRLTIKREGSVKKFVRSVQQVTFSGGFARERKQPVLYVTERAVFSLEPEGLVLREIAPGVELQRDVLGQMEFAPLVAPDLKPMSAALFTA
jgi:acyl CoA:acetate/3-ketoacid CoA transferase